MKSTDKKSNTNVIIISIGALAIALVGAGVFYRLQNNGISDPEALGSIPEVVEVIVEKPSVPEADIPVIEDPEAVVEADSPKPKPLVLPELNDSDVFVRDRVKFISSNTHFLRWITTDDVLRRAASYLDGLSRGVILSKIFPLTAPDPTFTTHRDAQSIWMNAGNYERYDATVNTLLSFDMEVLAQMFHLLRPLLEASFAEMGYQPRQMEGIILRSIDRVLATPIIVEPIELTRESVLYQYADPDLEGLLPLQKQILRTGPENTQKLQQQALALKTALLNP